MTAGDHHETWSKFEYSSTDGLRLAGRRYGWGNVDALPVVCLAGLTRNSADFHELAMHLAFHPEHPRRVLALDYRGRGMSQRDRDWRNYNPITEADDTLAGMYAAGIHEAVFVGTSRGGMIAMILAAMRPAAIRGVVLNDVGPQIDPRGVLRIRAYVDKGRDFDTWLEAVAAVRMIGEPQFPHFNDVDWARHARLIYEDRDGKVRRRYDPSLMRTLDAISVDEPLPTMWPQFQGLSRVPVMAIRGENSDLLSAETLARMAQVHPDLEAVLVRDQGHAPDLSTEELPQRIATFVKRAQTRSSDG
jgi:pimeloyl-ACP methyl ester carboxylesterase